MKYLIVLLALTNSVFADIPTTFVSNTPALASEVNRNFSHIDQRVSSLENAPRDCEMSDVNRIRINYNKKAGVLGRKFLVAQSSFTLIRVPFVDLVGNKYALTFPYTPSSRNPFTVKWIDATSYCWNNAIDGYPVRTLALDFERTTAFGPPDTIIGSQVLISQYIEILIGQTIVSFRVFGLSYELRSNYMVTTPHDFVGPDQFNAMTSHQDIIRAIDDMIDYISIEKLP
ncbi:MAG: hypothetical protein ACC707_03015 [Thiohalomonadales bacterium]